MKILATLVFSGIAAALGVISTTGLMCGVDPIFNPARSCEVRVFWMFGIPIAVVCAIVIGLPATLLFKKFKLFRWWQFVLGSTLIAVPFFIAIDEPLQFDKSWSDLGFEMFTFFGTAALAGLYYWFLAHITEVTTSANRNSSREKSSV